MLSSSEKMRDLSVKEIKYHSREFGEEVIRFATFALEESKRAKDAKLALEEGDTNLFAHILSERHIALSETLGFFCPELEWLCKRADEQENVKASAMVSIGVLGKILVVGNVGIQEMFEKLKEYEHIFDFHAMIRHFSIKESVSFGFFCKSKLFTLATSSISSMSSKSQFSTSSSIRPSLIFATFLCPIHSNIDFSFV